MVRESNPGGGEIFRTCPDRFLGPHSHLYNAYRVFPGGIERDAEPSPPTSAVVMKEKNYSSTPPVGLTACIQPQCLYKGALWFTVVHVILDCTDTTASISRISVITTLQNR
jgi:hypothetical protein